MLNHDYQVVNKCEVGKPLQHLEDYVPANLQQLVQPSTYIEHEVNSINIRLACRYNGSIINQDIET